MIASRRRSVSDLFLENGIWILKSHLQKKGHTVEPLDLATHKFYKQISPVFISRLIRFLYDRLLLTNGTQKHPWITKSLFVTVTMLQALNTFIRKKRMRTQLLKIAGRAAKRHDSVFGVKVWYGEAFRWADELSRMIKKKSPATITIAGGYHPSLYETDFMRFSSFDLGVTGEGEQPLEQILDLVDREGSNWDKERVMAQIRERVQSGDLVNTIIRHSKQDGKYCHKRVHPRILEKAVPFFEIKADDKMRVHILVDSLGCAWGKCNFCVHSTFFKKMVPRDHVKVVDEIEKMKQQNIGLFRFSGSDTYPQFGAGIAREILRRDLTVRFTIGARAVRNAKDAKIFKQISRQYEILIKSGLRAVFMGGETGNDWINEHVMNKGVNAADIRWTIRAMREAQERAGEKLYIGLALIYPVPTCNKIPLETVFRDNLELVKNTRPDSVMVSPPSPFKQNIWYKQRDRFGFRLKDNFISELIGYEYVLYKPAELWEDVGIELDGKNFKTIMKECGRMRRAVKDLGIETDISDEHFLIMLAAGYTGRSGEFKRQSLLDIISGDYTWSEKIGKRLNRYSVSLAQSAL